MKKKYLVSAGAALALAASLGVHRALIASDHDDGSQSTSQNSMNLTDLYAFREDNQTSNAADAGNLVLIMDSNGHTPAGQQVFFNTGGLYDFHVSRVAAAGVNTAPAGKDDVIVRFEFGEPDQKQQQTITVSAIKDGQTLQSTGGKAVTTSFSASKAGKINQNKLKIGNSEISVFAGLREDPFFFDVQQFFKVRAGAAGLGPKATFNPPETAVDGFAKQNVNSIVLRVPIDFLQGAAAEPVFDVWETTTIR
ncbi:MAG: DUF4331 family protein [Methylotenera sp.]|nr:DUF4331 family protein [Oligoflexia bacterium]